MTYWIIRVVATMRTGIDHHAAIDVDLNNGLFLLIIGNAVMALVVRSGQAHKLFATRDEILVDLRLVLVVLEWIRAQTADLPSTTEFRDLICHAAVAKLFAVIFKVLCMCEFSLCVWICGSARGTFPST